MGCFLSIRSSDYFSWLLDTYFTFFHGRRVGLCSGAFWRVKAGGVLLGPFGLVKFWYVSAGELGFVSAWQVSLRCVFILVRQVWCVVSILGGSGYVQV